jgi:hypothetical protein
MGGDNKFNAEYLEDMFQLSWMYYNFINHKYTTSRKRKSIIRKMFNRWQHASNINDEYEKKLWKLCFSDGTKMRIFFHNNSKALYSEQFVCLLQRLFDHKQINCPNN